MTGLFDWNRSVGNLGVLTRYFAHNRSQHPNLSRTWQGHALGAALEGIRNKEAWIPSISIVGLEVA